MSLRNPISPALLAVLAASSLGSCDALDYWESFEVQASGQVSRLVVDVDAGNIELVAADVQDVQVERHVQGWKGGITLESRVVDDVMTLTAHCEGIFSCRVDSRVLVPKGMDVSLVLGEGQADLQGLSQVVDVSVGRGSVTGAELACHELAVAVADGPVDLGLLVTPQQLTVTVAAGDVRVALPAGMYEQDLNAAAGQILTEGLQAQEGGPRLSVAVANGDVHLTGR